MGAGHGHRLHFHGHSAVHRAPAHLKILLLLAFVLAVVATPREWYPVFGGHLLLLLAVIVASRVPFRYLLPRMVLEVPFLVFAALIPFVAEGPRVAVPLPGGLELSLSESGLVAAWGLAVKGTLGVLASLTLAATTEPTEVLRGLQRLRMPELLVQIMGFMVRYLDVVSADLGRMITAMKSRGVDPRSPRQWPALARTLGALFVRSYERGERVHLAMLSRGYDGRLPDLDTPPRSSAATRSPWVHS
ncbi:MAG: cobalt ECF transporter T component CbiQ [Propionibacteriales bacterium]|nr:cobalt ECF transporter T component CbiQ [Propionibacteriales bacterium]